MQHAKGDVWAGVDVETEGVSDNFKNFVWEPALVKTNALSSAVEAATLILSVDETVRNPQSDQVCPKEFALCGRLIMLGSCRVAIWDPRCHRVLPAGRCAAVDEEEDEDVRMAVI